MVIAEAMVEIRFALGSKQAPKDCYVMVRLDGKQKVAPISGKECIHRFPQATVNMNRRVGVVELFRRVGSCEVDLHPSLGSRRVHMQCDELGLQDLCMHIVPDVNVDTSEKATGTDRGAVLKSQKEDKKDAMQQAAREYLAKHQVELELSRVLRAVLAAQPKDPKKFMAEKLLADRASDVLGAVPSDNRVQLSQSPAGAGMAAARHLVTPLKRQGSFEKTPHDSLYPAEGVRCAYMAGTAESISNSSERARLQAEDRSQIEIEDVLHLTEQDAVLEADAEEVVLSFAQAIMASAEILRSPSSAFTFDAQKPGAGPNAESSSGCQAWIYDEIEPGCARPVIRDETQMEVGVEDVFHVAEEDEMLDIAAETDACEAAQEMFELAVDPLLGPRPAINFT